VCRLHKLTLLTTRWLLQEQFDAIRAATSSALPLIIEEKSYSVLSGTRMVTTVEIMKIVSCSLDPAPPWLVSGQAHPTVVSRYYIVDVQPIHDWRHFPRCTQAHHRLTKVEEAKTQSSWAEFLPSDIEPEFHLRDRRAWRRCTFLTIRRSWTSVAVLSVGLSNPLLDRDCNHSSPLWTRA